MKLRNKNKKYKRSEYITPEKTLKTSLAKINWKLVGKLALSFALIFSVYYIAMYFRFIFIMPIYYSALIILGLVYIFINRGLPKKGEDKGRGLLLFIIPLIFTFIYEIVYTFYFME